MVDRIERQSLIADGRITESGRWRSVADRVDCLIGGVDNAADRIVALYRSAGSAERALGSIWYADARWNVSALSASSGRDCGMVADVLAVLSPRCEWSRNLAAAATMLDDDDAFPDGPLFANVVKAWRILQGEDRNGIVNGPKVRRFGRACNPLLRHDGSAVIDVWMLRALCGRDVAEGEAKTIGTEAAYRVAEAAVQRAARILGLPVHVVQATVWIVIRGRHN